MQIKAIYKKEKHTKKTHTSNEKTAILKLQNNKGVTLIALIVTVIVLLILSGVTIDAVFSDRGIIKQAQKAKEQWENSAKVDMEELNALENELNDVMNSSSNDETSGEGNTEEGTTGGGTTGGGTTGGGTTGGTTEVSNLRVNTSHSATSLSYTWEEISKIAKAISDNDETVTKSTSEVILSMDGKSYKIGIGDLLTLNNTSSNSYSVRVLGFNHDKLTDTYAYGGENTYAGISFEFVTFLTTAGMNGTDTNGGGWGGSAIRTTLNVTTKPTLENESYIKDVKKSYIQIYNDANSVTECSDYLWLLACSEIWDNPCNSSYAYGLAIANESTMHDENDTQTQYQYYKSNLGSTLSKSAAETNKKPNTSSASCWWLRSPDYGKRQPFLLCVLGRLLQL